MSGILVKDGAENEAQVPCIVEQEAAVEAVPVSGILDKAAAEAYAVKEGMAEAVKNARSRASELFRFRARTTESDG